MSIISTLMKDMPIELSIMPTGQKKTLKKGGKNYLPNRKLELTAPS